MIIGAIKQPYGLGYKLYQNPFSLYHEQRFNFHNITRDKIIKILDQQFDKIRWDVKLQRCTPRGSFYHIELSFNDLADEAFFIMLLNSGLEI